MTLRGDKNVGRFLISSPTHFIGEFEKESALISISFPNIFDRSGFSISDFINGNITSYFIISTKFIEDLTESPALVAQIDPSNLADLASVWFGKQFELHGWTESMGINFMPYETSYRPRGFKELGPFNQKPRRDLAIPLNFTELEKPFNLLTLTEPKEQRDIFLKAAHFYAHSLRAYVNDSEVAFLHLITALELLSSSLVFKDDDLFDHQTLKDFESIVALIPEGLEISKRFRSRLFQVRRRISLAASELTNDAFFKGTESQQHPQFALTNDNLDSSVKAAYDVRSMYVHSGIKFSTFLDINAMSNEIQIGEPVFSPSNAELSKLMAKMPSFLGLERLVRFMILRYAHLYIMPLLDILN